MRKKSGIYKKCNPTTYHWIGGASGFAGISYNCVITYTQARIELRLETASKEENKRLFDGLLYHKNEIDAQVTRSLQWDRKDNAKSSCIYCELNDVSLESRDMWQEIADFQGKMAGEMVTAFTPYLNSLYE